VSGDLTQAEVAHVRAAARFLRARMGGWVMVAKALRVSKKTARLASTPTMALRIARIAGVGVDAVLAGEYPPAGTCPHCGQPSASRVESAP
jgi:hypothetical protein